MNKKPYISPQLKTLSVQLGVFGSYTGDRDQPGGKTEPLRPITDLDLRME